MNTVKKEKRLKRFAETILTEDLAAKCQIKVKSNSGSFSCPSKNGFYIVIDEEMVNAPTEYEQMVQLKGILAHECGHVLFSDFELFGKVSQKNRMMERKSRHWPVSIWKISETTRIMLTFLPK